MKITKLTIRPEFEEAAPTPILEEDTYMGRTGGFPIPALPMGHTLDLAGDSLIVFIGDNGAGKTTALTRLAHQYSFFETFERIQKIEARIKPNNEKTDLTQRGKYWRATQFYDTQTTEGTADPKRLDVRYIKRAESEDQRREIDPFNQFSAISDLQEETLPLARNIAQERLNKTNTLGALKSPYSTRGDPCDLEIVATFDKAKEDPRVREKWQDYEKTRIRSTGQYQLGKLEKVFEQFNDGEIIILDQPEDGISMKNRPKLVNKIREYCKSHPNKQIILITHEPAFCRIPEARVVNLDEIPAQVYAPGEFNVDAYIECNQTTGDNQT